MLYFRLFSHLRFYIQIRMSQVYASSNKARDNDKNTLISLTGLSFHFFFFYTYDTSDNFFPFLIKAVNCQNNDKYVREYA